MNSSRLRIAIGCFLQANILMKSNSRTYLVIPFSVLCLLVLAGFAAGQARQQVTEKSARSDNVQSPSAPLTDQPSPDVSKYVGAETCKTCHEEIYNDWEKTPHWKTTLNTKGGPSKQGCEGCHGPGADHVAGGGDKTKIFVFEGKSRQETSARCLTCHGEGHEQSHFSESAHASNDVGCLDCHSPHHAKEKQSASPRPTPVVLRMPHLREGRFCQALSPSRQRRPGAMHRLPQPAWNGDDAAVAELCRAETPFATSATSISKAPSSTSMCR